jgi:N-acetylglucosamine kinase-like BadF-type ATPase
MKTFLGIDGGGTTTTCVVGDELRVLAKATAGGSSVVRLGEAIARNHLQDAVRAACSEAGVPVAEIQRVCAGVAGASAPAIRSAIRDVLISILALPAGQIQVVGDMEVALENALGEVPGLVVMAGTGSIAFGRNQLGETARAGGWGWAISDEGSGHWIGRTAVAAVVRAHDNGQATALTRAVFRTWGVDTLSDAVEVANASPGPDYAKLFPTVLAAAQVADALARQVLAEAGRELAALASTVIRRLWGPGQQVRVAIGGSVFRHSGSVRQAFVSHLRGEHPEACVSFGMVNPAEGALSLARKMAMTESARVR